MFDILGYGLIVFAGLFFLAVKLPTPSLLKLLGHSVWVDLFVTLVAFAMHFGTFSGTMVAAVAGLSCAGATTLGRRAMGYVEPGKGSAASRYKPGYWNLRAALEAKS